jgi:hypothetical protein
MRKGFRDGQHYRARAEARIIGRGRITKQECLAYYDDRPDECADIN